MEEAVNSGCVQKGTGKSVLMMVMSVYTPIDFFLFSNIDMVSKCERNSMTKG